MIIMVKRMTNNRSTTATKMLKFITRQCNSVDFVYCINFSSISILTQIMAYETVHEEVVIHCEIHFRLCSSDLPFN